MTAVTNVQVEANLNGKKEKISDLVLVPGEIQIEYKSNPTPVLV
jgi:hypothetical protein